MAFTRNDEGALAFIKRQKEKEEDEKRNENSAQPVSSERNPSTPNVLAFIARQRGDTQTATTRDTTNRDRITQSHGSRFERQEEREASRQSGSSIFSSAYNRLTNLRDAGDPDELEAKLGTYSTQLQALDVATRQTGNLYQQAIAAVEKASDDYEKFQQKFDLLNDIISNSKDPRQRANAAQQLKALAPYVEKAAEAYQASAAAYNGVTPMLKTQEQRYTDLINQYNTALEQYEAISSVSDSLAKKYTREADRWAELGKMDPSRRSVYYQDQAEQLARDAATLESNTPGRNASPEEINSWAQQIQSMRLEIKDLTEMSRQAQATAAQYDDMERRARALERQADQLMKDADWDDAWDRDYATAANAMQLRQQAMQLRQQAADLRNEVQQKRSSYGGEYDAKAREFLEKADRAQKRYDDYQYSQVMKQYNEHSAKGDWAQKSQADPKLMTPAETSGLSKGDASLELSAYRDPVYAIINGDKNALSLASAAQLDYGYYTKLTDAERQEYNYLYNRGDVAGAKAFLEKLTPYLTERLRGDEQKWWQSYASSHPWQGSTFSVLVSPLKAISFVGQAVDILDDGKIDQNASYNKFSNIPSDIRSAVAQKIEETWGGKAGSFVYQTGMSMADFLFNSFITGEFFGAGSDLTGVAKLFRPSLAIMGSGAAADTVIDLRNKGVDSTRAFILGAAAGLAEIITENVSLETLLNPELLADGVTKYVLKNMLAEGSEELGSDVLNWAADAIYDVLTGQNESQWKQEVRSRIKEGMSSREAALSVWKDKLLEAGLDALGGALSGGIMAGGGVGINYASAGIQMASAERSEGRLIRDTGGIGELIQAGLEAPEGSRAYELATKIRDQQDAGKRVSNRDLGRLSAENYANEQQQVVAELIDELMNETPTEATADTQAPRTPLDAALDKLSAGEQLTQNDAKRIMQNAEAMQTLRDAGVLPDTVRNDSAGRQIVRQAVEQYAAQQASQTAQETQTGPLGDTTAPATETNTESAKQPDATKTNTESGPPVPTQTQESKLRLGGSTLTPPLPQSKLRLGSDNRTEVTNNGKQAEAPAPAAEAREAGQNADRGRGRESGLDTRGGRTTQLDRGTARQAQTANAIRAALEARGVTYQSAKDIGLKDGTDAKTFAELPEDMRSRRLQTTVKDAAKLGITLHPIVGRPETQAPGEAKATPVRGWLSEDGKHIWVQVDNWNGKNQGYTWRQIYAHEQMHLRLRQNPQLREQILDKMSKDKKVAPYLEIIASKYIDTYAHYNMTSDQALEEMLCDYAGNFDMFMGNIDKNRSAQQMRKYVNEAVRGNKLRAADTAGEAAASRDTETRELSVEDLERRVEEEQPVSVSDESRASREFDSKFLENAIKRNNRSGHVPASMMNEVAKVRETIKAKLDEIQDIAHLPADVMANTYFPNSSYSGTEENTTVCPRSLSVDALADAVGEALGRPLTVEECVYVAQQAFHFTDIPQCLYCYVAMDRMAKRQLLGEYVNKRTQVITDLQNGKSVEEAFASYKARETSGGKQWSQNKQDRFDMWVRNYENNAPSVNMSDLASEARVEKALADPKLKAETEDALQYAQNASWAKKRVGFKAYDGHILKWSQKKVDALNSMFGLRMYSFSDYSPAYILENMQMVTDAAVRGLKMLAYTKELDFVKIFAGTGMNINISTFGMDGGDGTVHMDAMQGADWKEAQALRDKFPNVGITFVATNDNQVNWALDQDWIDVVIPFHMVKTGATVAEILGYHNYTGETSDKKIEGLKAAQKEIFPNQHQNNKEKYLAALQDANLTPRFERWLDNPNYMKLVNETRRSAEDTPAVQPMFDQDAVNAALKSIDDMVKRGGYGVPIGGSLENLVDIALDMSDDIRKGIAQDLRERNRKSEGTQYSRDLDTDYLSAVEAGDMETAQRMADEEAEAAKYVTAAYHGTGEFFNVFRRGSEGIHLGNEQTAKEIAKRRYRNRSQDTFYHWSGIRDRIGDMNEATRKQLVERMFDYYDTPEFSGDLSDASAVRDYVDGVLEEYRKTANKPNYDMPITLPTFDRKIGENVMRLYARLSNPFTVNGDIVEWSPSNIAMMLLRRAQGAEGMELPWSGKYVRISGAEIKPTEKNIQRLNDIKEHKIKGDEAWTVLSDILKEAGYDGIKYLNQYEGDKNSYSYIALNPGDVKSADPVTYDDDGNVIPLSERFNPDEEDIRYSLDLQPEDLEPYTKGTNTNSYTRHRSGKRKVSRVRTHAFELGGLYNEVEAQMAETQPSEFTYDSVSEQKSMREALGRLKKDFAGEAEKLSSSDQWGGSDLDTAMGILYQYRQIGRETGDYSQFNEWSHIIQQKGTKGGQFVQAFAKYSRTATGVAQKAAENLRDQHALTPAQQKRVEGHVNELMRAVDDFAEEAARGSVEASRGAKKGLRLGGEDSQKTKDAMNVIREIYDIFSQKTRRDHGARVEDWTKLTGDQLASRIASRFNSGNKQRTTMQIILEDLLTYASEHALPKREGKTPRTATERITDYLNNREAYGEAWSEAKQTLRQMYANDQDKLDLLEAFINSTISFNGDDMDRTMFRAILESADALGLTKDDILKLTAAGVNEGTIDRITEEFLQRIGSDETNLRDTVARHITNLVMADNQEGRLGRMENEAAKELDIKLQELLRESRQTKSGAANAIAQYLINDLGISGTDAAIAADHIASDYMRRIEQRAAKELERMFAEKGEKIKPKQRDKLLDLIHLGGLTNTNVEDAVVDALGIGKLSRAQQRQIMDAMTQFADTLDAIENDDLEGLRQLIRLQAAARNTRLSGLTEEILSGETDAEYLRNFATAQLGLIAADFGARSAGEKISTLQVISHLLNARTAMRNVTSNQIFDIVDSTANNVGLLSDIIMSKITGQRSVGFEKSWASQAKRQGAVKGAGRNILEVALDVDPEGRNQSKYGTGGRRTFSMANSGTVGRILSKAEEIMGYELNTTDEFHKGSVYAETLESLGRFVDAGYMTEEEAAEFAAQEALYRSFQDDTKVGAMLAGLKDVLNIIGTGKTNGKTIRGLPVHDFGLGDLVVKYTQVPGALIHRAIEYSPVGYMKAIYNIAQLANAKTKGESTIKQQRNAALSLGRATTGSGLIMAFTLLAKLGLLRRGDDEKDKNAAALKTSQGLSGTQINLTAISRLIDGESAEPMQGDVMADIGFLEPLDSLMTIAALINNDPEVKNLNLYEMFRSAETAKKIGEKSLQGIWLALEDTSAMQTLSNIYSTIRYHDEENDLPLYMQIPMEIASSSVSGFIPAPIRQLAQATDTTFRDQYRSRDLLTQTGARVANAIPGLRQTLAPKLTPLGEDKTYQKPLLNALNALLNPGNINVYQTDDVRDELLRVYEETGEGKLLPERNAPYSINIGNESHTLTPDERTEYLRIRGQAETAFVQDLLTADWYQNADDATKASFLNSARNIANDIAKVQWAAEREITYHDTEYRRYLKMLADGSSYADVIKAANEKLADTVEAGIPRQVWDDTKTAFNDISNSDISSYEKGVQQRALISDLDLTDEQKLTIYGNLANADSRTEQFRTIMDTGLSFNDTAKIFDQYSAFKSDDDSKASQDAKDFALWVDQRKDLTSEQKKVIKEQFKYWQMIPAEAERYERFTSMGFSPEVANRIDSALSALQPLPGHEGVTDMQRATAALGALGKEASKADQMKIVEAFYGGDTKTKSGELSQWGKIKKVTGSGVAVDKTLKLVEDGKLDVYVKWMDSEPKKKGVQSNTYISFVEKYNSTTSTRDANGKEVKGETRKDKMMSYINGLNLSIEQKDSLFLEYYAESGLKDTPWHKNGGSSGSGKTFALGKLRLGTPERRAPSAGTLRLGGTPAQQQTSSRLKLK